MKKRVMDKQMKETERAFMNLSVEEMAAKVRARDAQLGRRNCLILVLFSLGTLILLAVGFWIYGSWIMETVGAFGRVVSAIANLNWMHAGAILLEYRLSFFLMGILVGFFLFLFIVFQIGEILIDLIWDWVGSLFG